LSPIYIALLYIVAIGTARMYSFIHLLIRTRQQRKKVQKTIKRDYDWGSWCLVCQC